MKLVVVDGQTHILTTGKTFIVGEYIALTGGPTLLLTTEPNFCLKILPNQDNLPFPFHPQSAAGLLIQQSPELSDYCYEFVTPYHVAGLGGSSAEFLTLYRWLCYVRGMAFDALQALSVYRSLYQHQKTIPSGADVVAQSHPAGIVHFHAKTNHMSHHSWPFNDLAYSIVATNQKIATHEYLKKLNLDDNQQALNDLCQTAIDAFMNANSQSFCQAINQVASYMIAHRLVTPQTQEILSQVKKHHCIKAAKGCGAMGADIILVIYDKFFREEYKRILSELYLQEIAHN